MLYCVRKLAVLGSTECFSKVLAIVYEDFGVFLSGSSLLAITTGPSTWLLL